MQMPLVAFLALSFLPPATLALAAPVPQTAVTRAPDDEAAIRLVITQYVAAREAQDPRAIEALFTADADQLVSSGEWRRGRDAVVAGTMRSSAQTGGTRTITVETVRMVAAGAAIADGRYEISGLAGGATRRMWTSFVLVREDGTWRIAAVRNMLPAAP
jgi:uncharacterized protein (TIGR02246 family)